MIKRQCFICGGQHDGKQQNFPGFLECRVLVKQKRKEPCYALIKLPMCVKCTRKVQSGKLKLPLPPAARKKA